MQYKRTNEANPCNNNKDRWLFFKIFNSIGFCIKQAHLLKNDAKYQFHAKYRIAIRLVSIQHGPFISAENQRWRTNIFISIIYYWK